ncbi:SAC3/GANP/Nin1/mts3/eIF-3 p25 family-domain-containing protein [Dactylonectria estremocensis]|uniref:SAC3/GANP/Nin1/mts3/eIF-3 p25 family-domain-containing protein n=1 Tax=Dactylonectria estremocensis TaxID=1079267 RepID=A0A9P9JB91_9HYPO|nr:SAC3/GANP/Nin1/mts3/eIF-3 p25 family-domain-containing protein [Dactylonectria estremocensis]
MTATSVAPSRQMFSAFGQPTRSPSPAVNPFATNSDGGGSSFGLDGAGDSSWSKRNKRSSRRADQSDNEGKRKVNNPFQDKDANASDGGNKNGKNGDEKKKKGADLKNQANGVDPRKKPMPVNKRGNGHNPFGATRPQGSRPSSSSSTDINDTTSVPESHQSNNPHARKVFEQLRKDGISPPQWPSQPGNPKNKTEVTKFREKYEAYRDKVRVSLTKAGLIDDPEKRKTLQDAISFKGICEEMCPEYEKITRINEMDVHQPEKNPKTTFPNTQRMVKKLARSAAGQEAPLPMDVRSIAALRRTLDYLIDDLLQNDQNLPIYHSFLWDRTRAIRRDFTFFSSLTSEEMKDQVYVLENIARFHVTALHLLSQEGKAPQDFVEQQELEQLGKALLSLRDLYDDCNEQSVVCANEAEFRAYYLVFHAFDPNIIETLQRQWKPNLWRDSDEVRTAVSLVEALQNTQHFHGPLNDAPSLAASAAYHTYFRIIEDPKVSYTMACFAECHFPHLRRSILTTVKKALARPRESSKDVTTAVLNKFLRFDTIQQAIDFAELHNFEFGQCEEDPSDLSRQYLILDNRKPLPHHRLQHHFSQKLVEKKRGSRTLPDLIHQSVLEDPNAPKPLSNGSVEESLFVSDTEAPITQAPSSTTPRPLASFSSPAGGSGNNSAFNGNQGMTPLPRPAPSSPGTPLLQSSSTPSVLGLASTSSPTTSREQKPASLPPAPPPSSPPPPPRDLMGEFTKWYVEGDGGLIEDFRTFMLDNMLQGVFRKFQKDEEKKKQQEAEEQAVAKADKFRVYNLSLKYFYRWRETARELRLRQLRRSGRDQMRSYYEAQRAMQLKQQKEAARQAAKERAELAEVNHAEEFRDLLKRRKPSKRQAKNALLASGVLSGVNNEAAAVAQIVEKAPSVSGSVSSSQSTNLSRSSNTKGVSKTQLLREKLLGGDPSPGFRRSLPPMSSRGSNSPDPRTRVSGVSERWRLKAMGIVQMPDGTALPESLANDARYRTERYSRVGSMGPPTTGVVRRASIADLTRPDGQRLLSGSGDHVDHGTTEALATKNKRKRSTGDDGEISAASKANAHKRVMSDAQNLISELRAMREEMEESTSWFKDQNERLQSEIESRGSTPWDESI